MEYKANIPFSVAQKALENVLANSSKIGIPSVCK